MNLLRTLYPYGLAAVNLAIGWLSYTRLTLDVAVPFLSIGLLVLVAVVGRTVSRYRHVRDRARC